MDRGRFGTATTERGGLVTFETIVRKVLGQPELIGNPDCPIIHRWGIFGEDVKDEDGKVIERKPVKLLLHHFLPNSADRDPHDHPRPFYTFVLAGDYVDEEHVQFVPQDGPHVLPIAWKHREHMTTGRLKFRAAGHTHTTVAGSRGCGTLVLMGPVRRPWGFWRSGRWWSYEAYKERFGHGMDCS